MSDRATQACLLTGDAPAAVAVIGLWGPQAIAFLQQLWVPNRPGPLQIDRIRYGQWEGAEASQQRPGEGVVVCLVGEDRLEIHCHGGRAAARRILDDLQQLGCEPVTSARWLETDPSHRRGYFALAAWEALPMASTSQVAAALLVQSRGAMDRQWGWIAEAIDGKSRLEALAKIDSVRRWLPWSLQWLRPCRIALAGLPNAGKSSLLNAFAGFTRSIVHDTPGTTRDLISQRIALGGWPLELIDTAGLRQSSDEIESLGIAAARRILDEVDFVWLLTAADQPWTSDHEAWMETLGQRCWVVRTKCDLTPVEHLSDPLRQTAMVTVLDPKSVERLAQKWLDRWIPEGWTVDQPALFLPEQGERLEQLWQAVSSENWTIAKQLLNCTDTSYRT